MRIVLSACLLVLACTSFSQNGSIRGFVLDSLNGEPLAFVIVAIKNTTLGAQTDFDGLFLINNVPPGQHVLTAQMLGYNSTFETIDILPGKTTNVNFKLKEDAAVLMPMPTPYKPVIKLDSINPKDIILPFKFTYPFDQPLPPVLIESTRASRQTPISYTELLAKDIAPLNTGQDLPYLLRFTPSLVTTSDAGNGIGYTGLWIRGSDPSRINVTINGIPLNDPESQQVFWVNTPDFGSSVNSIQIQRGVGTSANGAASFGGSIKLETRDVSMKPFAESQNSYGSFNSIKNNLSIGTGLMGKHFVVEARVSRIASDGYIDRASSDLKSLFVEGNYISEKTTIKLSAFSGKEVTYQSWNGTPWEVLNGNNDDKLAFAERNLFTGAQTNNLVTSGRTYNYYTYKNQVDDYRQDHYQAHIKHYFGKGLALNASGHYTKGQGFFEEYKEDQLHIEYGLPQPTLDSLFLPIPTDLVRRRWLKNDFIGGVFSLIYTNKKIESVLGGAANEYKGHHFGQLNWIEIPMGADKDHEYYRGKSLKHDANVYWKTIYTIHQKLDIYADLQLRRVGYQTKGIDNDLRNYKVDTTLLFFNPKAGITYRPKSGQRVYLSAAMGSKEPNRNDYVDTADPSKVKPESMIDFEGGYEFGRKNWHVGANLYYMDYKNQLVLTGVVNDVGAPLRINVPNSFRTGIELEASAQIWQDLRIYGNLTLSRNKIQSFNESLIDYSNDEEIISIRHEDTNISFSPSIISAGRLTYNIYLLSSEYYQGKLNFKTSVTWQSKYVGKQYLDNTQSELRSIDAYTTSDIILYHEHNFANWQGNIQFTINNVFNSLYSSNGYTYGYIYETRISERFYYPQAGRNFMISIGVKV
ncbi:MAG: TonB-dependent receptor [Flavobacteriales bacterium]